MNIHRFEYFITVANTGSFSEAAEILFTTQGAVSKQIISLEKELNVKLFNRNSRKASLTPEGQNVLLYAKDILEKYREMNGVLDMLQHDQNNNNTVCLAAIPVYRLYNIQTILDSFNEKYPSITLRLEELEYKEFINPLEEGYFEIAFTPQELIDENKFECLSLCRDYLSVAMQKSHPLANEKSIRISQLRNDKFIFISKLVGMYDACVKLCNKNGFSPQVLRVGSHPQNLSKIVEKEGFVCLAMGKITQSMCNDEIVSLPIEGGFHTTMVLTRKKDSLHSHGAEMFWNHTRDYTDRLL